MLVEPDDRLRATIAASIDPLALVDVHDSFDSARQQLATTTYRLVVTNLRLQEYNGIHLAYVIQETTPDTRVIVYAGERDLGLAGEVQRACAFFELMSRIPIAVRAYFVTSLPPRDRRDPEHFDRRRSSRGGRRLWDLHTMAAMGSA